MAHKVACNRKKCIKSTNCFRDREELSSLYTISSHSTSSVPSTEMIAQTNRQNYQNRTFIKEEMYNGDSNRKSPPICTCNMRNGVHQNSCSCYRDYYNERIPPYLKNKYESFPMDTCEYVRQCCTKPCCPVHQYNKPKYCTNLKNLEECYWAKWKPSKFECMQRRRGCCECDCPKLNAPRTQDKSVEVIREPGMFENASSNENATVQRSTKDLYNKVLSEYNNQYAEQTSLNKSLTYPQTSFDKTLSHPQTSFDQTFTHPQTFFDKTLTHPQTSFDQTRGDTTLQPEYNVRFGNKDRVLEFDSDSVHNRKFYSNPYEEYENQFIRKLEENEEHKSEYYQELYNDMYNEYENELLSRMPSDQTETTETMPLETESMRAETEITTETDTVEEKTDSITVLHKPEKQKIEDDKVPEEDEEEEERGEEKETPKPEVKTSVQKDLNISPTGSDNINTSRKPEEQVSVSQQKIVRPPSFAAEHLPLKGHTYPLKSVPKKQPQDKNRSKNGLNRVGSPGSLNYLPAYLLRIAANK